MLRSNSDSDLYNKSEKDVEMKDIKNTKKRSRSQSQSNKSIKKVKSNKKENIILFGRVSSKNQITSFPNQNSALFKYCNDNIIKINTDIYNDDTNIEKLKENRVKITYYKLFENKDCKVSLLNIVSSGYNKNPMEILMKYVETEEINKIIVFMCDRISRNINHFSSFLEEFISLNNENNIYSICDNIDIATSKLTKNKFLEEILKAQNESTKLGERIKNSKFQSKLINSIKKLTL